MLGYTRYLVLFLPQPVGELLEARLVPARIIAAIIIIAAMILEIASADDVILMQSAGNIRPTDL